MALPVELDEARQNELLRSFVAEHVTAHGVAADVCIHRGNPENPHCHVLMTTREAGPEGLGGKVREIDKKRTTEGWREQWAEFTNRELERAGSRERVDHRSNRERGISREPGIHEGPNVRGMERRGVRTAVGDRARHRNADRDQGREPARNPSHRRSRSQDHEPDREI